MKRFLKLVSMVLFVSFFLGCDDVSSLPVEGKIAPDFTLQTIDGKSITLSTLKGKKVLIDFFATWCPPCRRELAEINEIVNEYKNDNYEILCISVDNSIKPVLSYIAEHKYTMKVLFDDQGIAGKYGVSGIPALFLVDEQGNLVWQQAGALSKEKLIELLEIKKA